MSIKLNEKMLFFFKEQAVDDYLNRLVTHCQTNYPHLKKIMNSTQLKEVLQGCLSTISQRGFVQEDTTRFYIDLMIILGVDFENDPQYSWVRRCFSEYSNFGELTRAEVLYYDVMNFLDFSYGKDFCNKAEIYRNLRAFLEKDSSKNPYHYVQNFSNDVSTLAQLTGSIAAQIAPAKFNATTQEDFTALVAFGMEKTNHLINSNNQQDIINIILLMFIFGSHFYEDPFLMGLAENKAEVNQPFTENEVYTYRRDVKFYECFPWLIPVIEINTN